MSEIILRVPVFKKNLPIITKPINAEKLMKSHCFVKDGVTKGYM